MADLVCVSGPSAFTLLFRGAWVTSCLKQVLNKLETCSISRQHTAVILNFSELSGLDTSGAYVIEKFCEKLDQKGVQFSLQGLSSAHQLLFDLIRQKKHLCHHPDQDREIWFLKALHDLGRRSYRISRDSLRLLSFVGEVVTHFLALFRHPGLLKRTSVFFHLQKVGIQALPIVGLISFLIGVVMVYQGAHQLKRFGAEIFTIDLLAVSVLREIGILITAIVVAGRSGSAFTAQIGTMSLNQEIDALRVMGLNPIQYLVVPRVLALFIALPLLGFFANLMALFGGALMGCTLIGTDLFHFFQHLQLAIKPWTFWTGMIKAPIFAAVIAIVGCFEGMRVAGGAESVGRHTTKSVVKSIFLVIVIDAAFSIFYALVGV